MRINPEITEHREDITTNHSSRLDYGAARANPELYEYLQYCVSKWRNTAGWSGCIVLEFNNRLRNHGPGSKVRKFKLRRNPSQSHWAALFCYYLAAAFGWADLKLRKSRRQAKSTVGWPKAGWEGEALHGGGGKLYIPVTKCCRCKLSRRRSARQPWFTNERRSWP